MNESGPGLDTTSSTDALSLEGLIFETIDLQQQDHILTITLNRPQRKNAINAIMSNELIYALDYARQQRSIRVVVLAATGDVFCAGGDLRSMSGTDDESISNVPKRGEVDDISLRLRHLYKPTIAKIQGAVVAGALLLVCNVTHAIAASNVQFSAPEIKRGIWPFMVMAGLFRLVPKRVGLNFISTGEPIDSATAKAWGLINDVVSLDQLDSQVTELAASLAALAPNTMRLGLQACVKQEDMTFDQALPYLKTQIDACLNSADAKEGISAFLEKRKPHWD